MIEMWDPLFIQADPQIEVCLTLRDGRGAFERMHRVLDLVWEELFRVLKDGAFACINIGDATRTLNGSFQLFANHARVQKKLYELGFNFLPAILWRKQTNAPNKFMGSGMLPAGAYVTLEHEYILICRKGAKRVFATAEEKQNRLTSSYFWEERNVWFSDLWEEKGVRQGVAGEGLRNRGASFPLLLPFRLINMYSVYGDTVLDPFLGTGTSLIAAIAAGRNSVGYEIDRNFKEIIQKRLDRERLTLNRLNFQRIMDHIAFTEKCVQEKRILRYANHAYGFPVMTKQEREIKFVFVENIKQAAANLLHVSYYSNDFFEGIDIKDLNLQQLLLHYKG
jgi:modification methylase